MEKIDPYKHKERWERWEEKTTNGIPDISKKNSDLIKQYKSGKTNLGFLFFV